jgi:membrane protease YdiL (CAAX protease family)
VARKRATAEAVSLKQLPRLSELVAELRRQPRRYELLFYLLLAGLVMVCYVYLILPLVHRDLVVWLGLDRILPGDLPFTALRFGFAFLLLGCLPVLVSRALGGGLRTLGLRRTALHSRLRATWFVLPLAVAAGLVAAYRGDLFAFYPYSRSLLALASEHGLWVYLPYALCYVLFYYLPWELFFRGFLIFPFLKLAEYGPEERRRAALLVIVGFQALPSALLHFGHPLAEALGAVPFGLFLGYLALKSGSIVPGLIIHALLGLSLDLFVLLRHLGVLP